MSKPGSATTISSLLLFLLLLLLHATANTETPSTYIVHVSQPAARVSSSLLRSLPGPTPRVLYHYTLAARGFSAALTPPRSPSSAAARTSSPSAATASATPTPPTPPPSSSRTPPASGPTPTSPPTSSSASSTPASTPSPRQLRRLRPPPPPPSWRGSCHPSFPCNRKIVGAKFFAAGYEAAHGPVDESKESRSPLDTEGHGTHTASTAAGSEAPGAGFYSYARGTARGMAARARIAAYKICWASGCYDSDILAAMDAAVADGVDVISLSVGASGRPPPFHRDSIAIGAFGAAVRHGVVVSCSAGNSGPGAGTAVNVAPWILTVGASTVDREFPADVALGDGSVLPGVLLYAGEPLPTGSVPLVSGSDCGSRLCIPGNLDSAKVAGKIVLCDRGSNARVEKGSAVKLAGARDDHGEHRGERGGAPGRLAPHPGYHGRGEGGEQDQELHPVRPLAVRESDLPGDRHRPRPAAPKVASFSSRGPNYRAPEIIKPDVIAPGVNILAAWTGESAPTDLEIDPRRVEFNIISGTSMSCPHVSGLAALLRKARPGWSPAAIKSALMTTAYNSDNSGRTIVDLATGVESTPFVRGSGHVDPNRALDPGLVYDLQPDDYIAFLCSLGYGPQQIGVIARDGVSVNCSSDTAKRLSSPGALNYPSFGVTFSSDADAVTYGRV
ncbi:putative subtilisin-like protease SBT1.4 [Iris pallida]|uniref:Subtilisin-like protease SBT1.4 n=1 Tax=Iris pallida TaxID=29817 RepID=A0AAX6GMR3_IRIPA|nr:putative subtilisin-like protease SBT1.4 [Iris pallida]